MTAIESSKLLRVLLDAVDAYVDHLGYLEYGDPEDGDIETDAAERQSIIDAVATFSTALPEVLDAAQKWQAELAEYVIPAIENAVERGDQEQEDLDGQLDGAHKLDAALIALTDTVLP